MEFIYAFLAGMALPLAIGLPIAALLGFGPNLRTVGVAAACGLSIILIVCRAIQMVVPIAPAALWLLLAYAVALVALWSPRRVRETVSILVREHGAQLVILGVVIVGIAALLNAPILFDGAIQFEGTRNADSLIFTSIARHMLGHPFNGAPDFSPEHPIYQITQGYFVVRSASEGFLAWLSALRGIDPMYFYNAVQTAGVLLAGLAVLMFMPVQRIASTKGRFVIVALIVLACPTLLYVAMNSNFPNSLTLAAATGYVGLSAVPRSRSTFIAAILFIGCLLSGYPEILVFVGAMRFFAVACGMLSVRQMKGGLREIGMLLAEVVAACALVPWSALGTFTVYKATLEVSQGAASGQIGYMYAGLPLAGAAALTLLVAWRALARIDASNLRPLFVGILIAFGLALAAMVVRNYDYGGFKLSEYFVTSFQGILVVCVAALLAKGNEQPLRLAIRAVIVTCIIVVVAGMVVRDGRMIRRSWSFAEERRVSPDLVSMGRWLAKSLPGEAVLLGQTPASFYYGHWVPYVTDAHVVFDFTDPDAAGYLSPYLRDQAAAHASGTNYVLTIDEKQVPRLQGAADVVTFGSVHLVRRTGL
ncbi:hypothetical protein SAMN05216570_1482 [Dyella sp. OK004]|uniref:hypothetical protein n=1 Tax=Dyella sp. OK004 TaxID=1855292 RepID=UPI0008E1FA4C|nr:hypothetical protein [Dyella sp. OK004]SFS01006.1 hypothetical protein SAMN05216570_1482 [Dyella sp. OK004]